MHFRNTFLLALILLAFLVTPNIAWPQEATSTANPQQLAKKTGIKLPDDFRWLVSENIVYYFPESAQSRVSDIVEVGSDARREIFRHIGIDSGEPIQVYLVSSSKQYQRLQPRGQKAPDWAVGLAYGSLGVIYLRQAGSSGSVVNLRQTFIHELSHILMRRALDGRDIPRWFSEGVAMYHARQFDFERIKTVGYAILMGRLIPLQGLESRFPQVKSDINLAYAESFEFVNFLVNEFGEANFQQLIQNIASGKDFYAALEIVYTMPLDELEAMWISDLKMSYTWLPALTSGGTIWGLAALILVIGYISKRRIKKKKMKEWEIRENRENWSEKQLPPQTAKTTPADIVKTEQGLNSPEDPDDHSPRSNDPTKYIH